MTDFKFKTLIIDDEEPARLFLKELLQEHSAEIEIIGEAKDGIDAVQLINALKPELIFLDIEMPGKNGFEMLENLDEIPLVVFCTAFDEYALNAFETNSIDYLVKPVKPERLNKTIKKLKNLNHLKEHLKIKELLQTVIKSNPAKQPTTFPVKIGDRVIFLKMNEISFFTAKDKYVEIHTFNNKSYNLDQSLNSLESKLPNHFIRVQRGYIINTELIREIKNYSPGKYSIFLDDRMNTKIVTGRNYSALVNELVKI